MIISFLFFRLTTVVPLDHPDPRELQVFLDLMVCLVSTERLEQTLRTFHHKMSLIRASIAQSDHLDHQEPLDVPDLVE